MTELEDFIYSGNEGRLYRIILEQVERRLFERILEQTCGNQLKASRLLGINRNTMRAKIRKLGINLERWKKN